MAAGDALASMSSVDASAYLTIQPGSGVEWCIHNILCGGTCELYLYDGSNELKFDTQAANAGWISQVFFITNSVYLRVKNTGASAAYFGYTGVVTK